MARVRLIDICNFRSIKRFTWAPSAGLNCLIGPGDSGKSSVLDAIDWCLGAKRTLPISDADFFELNVNDPISVSITLGALDDALKSMETYGDYLRSFDPETQSIDDEPESGKETVLTLNLAVKSDLEPVWTLISERAEAKGQSRYLTWTDRLRLCPTRIGAFADHDLAWRRGSVLTRLSDEKAETSGALADAARQARITFGDLAEKQLSKTLDMVAEVARYLGINIGAKPKALLDAHSVSFSGGTIALHNETGVPLRGLGTGSARLLVAGLQRMAAKEATVILINEVEHGLEPYRLRRLLHSIGSKDAPPPLQGFLTTHSPAAVRELSVEQLTLLRRSGDRHDPISLASKPNIQGTARASAEAFLATSVVICEGASEVGLMRGLDQWRVGTGKTSIMAIGVELVDAGGCDNIYARADAFREIGYRVTVLRDDDKQPDAAREAAFSKSAGPIHKWRAGRKLEEELFASLPDASVTKLVEIAIEMHGEELVASHVTSASENAIDLAACRAKSTPEHRKVLAKASSGKATPWFKSVSAMEQVAREIVGPELAACDKEFREIVERIFAWVDNARD
jgi:hypothetical protein